MINLKSLFCAVLILTVGVEGTSALEITKGKLKLIVNEKNGRFSLYSTNNVANPLFVPLFWAVDPTTSKVKVKVGDKIFVLGDTDAFTPKIAQTADGVQIDWASRDLHILESWDFVTSSRSPVVDGVKWSFQFRTGLNSLKVGLRIVLDTYLGEGKDHFLSPDLEKINQERVWTSPPDLLISPSGDPGTGLLIMVGKVSTPPDRTVVANWKRLDDSSWDFDGQAGRDFSLLPYSYNDSAVAFWYDSRDLSASETRNVALYLGVRSAQSFAGASVGPESRLGNLLESSRASEADLKKAAKQNLVVLDDLLSQIAEKQKARTPPTEEEMQILQAALDQMEQQKKLFQATAP